MRIVVAGDGGRRQRRDGRADGPPPGRGRRGGRRGRVDPDRWRLRAPAGGSAGRRAAERARASHECSPLGCRRRLRRAVPEQPVAIRAPGRNEPLRAGRAARRAHAADWRTGRAMLRRTTRVPAERGLHDVHQNLRLCGAVDALLAWEAGEDAPMLPHAAMPALEQLASSPAVAAGPAPRLAHPTGHATRGRPRGYAGHRDRQVMQYATDVVLQAGCGNTVVGRAKRLPDATWAEVIDRLHALDRKVTLIEGPDERGVGGPHRGVVQDDAGRPPARRHDRRRGRLPGVGGVVRRHGLGPGARRGGRGHAGGDGLRRRRPGPGVPVRLAAPRRDAAAGR